MELLAVLVDDPTLISMGDSALPIITGVVFFEGMKAFFRNLIGALGLQASLVPILFFSNYVVQFSIQWYLCFRLYLGLPGIWYAKVISEILINCLCYWFVNSRDWAQICIVSRDRQNKIKAQIEHK